MSTACLLGLLLAALQPQPDDTTLPRPACATDHAAAAMERLVRRADLPPATTVSWSPPPAAAAGDGGPAPLVTADDFFLVEDTDGFLVEEFSFETAVPFLAQAANALVAEHGDEFDLIGFWTNYEPGELVSMFYASLRNDVTGIGQGTFDNAAAVGLTADRVQGLLMMWNVNQEFLQPGTGPDADIARLFLSHELLHRFAMYLPPLGPGLPLQGQFIPCGRPSHWNASVDHQGSCLESGDWVGTSPAVLDPGPIGIGNMSYNADIPGGVYSYLDLYLMGFVSAAEVDAAASQLRFMDGSGCDSPHHGSITTFSMADVVAAAGPRVPDSTTSQKDFRMGWVMFHLPGAPPTLAERTKAAAILNQNSLDWNHSTLGRGTLDHTLGEPSVFADLGFGLAGTHGAPHLDATGTLAVGTHVRFEVTDLLENDFTTLIVGASQWLAPFAGGFIVPNLDLTVYGLPTGPDGHLVQDFVVPPGLPPGVPIFVHYWIEDPGGIFGFAASNAVMATTP